MSNYKLFDLKPCGECPMSSCVEGQVGVKCPYDELVENKMNKETKPESVESQIDNFIIDKFNKSKDEIKSMTIQNKMSMVGMKSQEKWDEFKFGLRKVGYII